MTLHVVAESAPERFDRFAVDWQRWSLMSWRQASLAYAVTVHNAAQLLQVAALSATYGAQTLGAFADLLVAAGTPMSERDKRPPLAAVPDTPTLPSSKESTQDAPAQDEPAPEAPPVPRWDQLTLGSIRGQLRRWDVDTLGALYAYELRHGNRPAVVSMLANRIAKMRPSEE